MKLHCCQAPQAYETKDISIFGHVRLFNRNELLTILNVDSSVGDLEIIAHLYNKCGWQHHCADLNGQFGYVIYDKRKSAYILVRDHLGCTPLYYRVDDRGLFVSTLIKAIASQSPRKLNQKVMLEWLANGSTFNQEETFFADIKKLPKGTALRINQDGTEYYQYWSFRAQRSSSLNSEKANIEHLKGLLYASVKCRMAASGIIAAHSSGGLDSTPIAIMASQNLTSSQSPLHTFNWCTPKDTNQYNHEWDDARKVAEIEGFSHHEIGITAETLKRTLLNHNVALDGTTMHEYENNVLALAQNIGVKTIFSGFGGDECLTSRWREAPLEAIRRLQLKAALQSLWLQTDKRKSLPQLRVLKNFLSSLPKAYSPKFKRKNRGFVTEQKRLALRCSLLTPQFFQLAKEHARQYSEFMLADTIYDKQIFQLENGYHQERMESWYNMGGQHEIEYVYPYLDRRLIEFALALPSDLYYRNGKPRYLYNKALLGIIPRFLFDKPKLPEKWRVTHLVQQRIKALTDEDVLEHIYSMNSVFIDRKNLVSRIQALRKLDIDSANFRIHAIEAAALTNAILAMNVEHYFASGVNFAKAG